ncbi:MAG: M48 family metallopeptidase [Candidatus Paceibacterota bacterium]|jgi:heat shock protein HtpX
MTTFLVLVIFLGYIFSLVLNSPVVLYIAVAISLLMNFSGYWFSDKIALSLSGAKQASREEYFEFYNLVENLSITAGLPMPKIYVIEDKAPNAFATGRDKDHSSVAVTSGLLSILNKKELEGVVAHELSHIGNRDILLSSIVVVLVGFVSIASDLLVRILFWGGRDNSREDTGAGALVTIAGVVLAIFAPIFASLIHLAISRKREFLADASGVLLTRYPEGLASALEKIGSYSGPMVRASGATAHLFISSPFGAKMNSGISRLFMTHPPIEERIKALREKSF